MQPTSTLIFKERCEEGRTRRPKAKSRRPLLKSAVDCNGLCSIASYPIFGSSVPTTYLYCAPIFASSNRFFLSCAKKQSSVFRLPLLCECATADNGAFIDSFLISSTFDGNRVYNMIPRKQPSGAQNRKRKKQEQKMANSLQGYLNKFFLLEIIMLVKTTIRLVIHLILMTRLKTTIRLIIHLIIVDPIFENDEFVDKDEPNEINIFDPRKMLPDEAYKCESPWTSIQIMEFARRMDMFPNVLVAYKILLTISVTIASAERSFSKLKLLKTYLRSTMIQEKFNGLVILSIETKNEKLME
ncbi:hypothetical protein LXL04_019425 [Taraxacum kok-saghyz]